MKYGLFANRAKWGLFVVSLSFASVVTTYAASSVKEGALYCVIDLSGGSNAASYPVTYMDAEPSEGFSTTPYKTTKLVMKRVNAGSFTMGDSSRSDNQPHTVTLKRPFYMGLYEVTQKQWELVTGTNVCSLTSKGKGDTYPVHYVSYNMIRGASKGANWPTTNAVDGEIDGDGGDSFLGILRKRTGLDFDLPTEAQWEYACRAGSTTAYGYGDSADGSYMWYDENSSYTSHEVGTRLPNELGFYDMHGNVWEWCLDWYSESLSSGTDPQGPISGSERVKRGGTWRYSATDCTSSLRGYNDPSIGNVVNGFRLCRTFMADAASSDDSNGPYIPGDSLATVTGDATSGWTVAPSEGVSSVEVTIPDGVDAAKVTVEVGADVAAVTPHGAKVKVVSGGHDITDYLDVPSADAAGSIDLTKAAVKEAVVKEAMDPSKGAKFEVKASEPTLTTSATKPGLTYTLREGTMLGGMSDGASKLGDGSPWTPAITVKGGASGFYSIKVTK